MYSVSFLILFLIFQNSFGLKLAENKVSHDLVDEEYKYYMRWYTGATPKGSDNYAGADIVGEHPVGQVDPGDAASEAYTKATRPQDSGREDAVWTVKMEMELLVPIPGGKA